MNNFIDINNVKNTTNTIGIQCTIDNNITASSSFAISDNPINLLSPNQTIANSMNSTSTNNLVSHALQNTNFTINKAVYNCQLQLTNQNLNSNTYNKSSESLTLNQLDEFINTYNKLIHLYDSDNLS